MPLGNSGQRCCQGCGCTKQLCLLFPGSLPLQELAQSYPSQPFQHWKPHNQFASTERATQDSMLLLTAADQGDGREWSFTMRKSFPKLSCKTFSLSWFKNEKKKSTPTINDLVENRPHLLTCHILCSGILYLQVRIPSLSKESIPNKKMLHL